MSDIEERVIQRIRDRGAMGLTKYGVTLERTDLSAAEWIIHAQEEMLDGSAYLERLKDSVLQLDQLRADNARLKGEVEAMTKARDLYESDFEKAAKALRESHADLQAHKAALEKARVALDACCSTFGHAHWDETMQHGVGCPKCIDQLKARALAVDCTTTINSLLGQGVEK